MAGPLAGEMTSGASRADEPRSLHFQICRRAIGGKAIMNGWQRLFVLVSVLWAFAIGAVAYMTSPATTTDESLNVGKFLAPVSFPGEQAAIKAFSGPRRWR